MPDKQPADLLTRRVKQRASDVRDRIPVVEQRLEDIIEHSTITPSYAKDAVEAVYLLVDDLNYLHDIELALCEYFVGYKSDGESFEIVFGYYQLVNNRLCRRDARAFTVLFEYQGESQVACIVPRGDIIPIDYFDDLAPADPEQNDFLRGVRWFGVDLNDLGLPVVSDTTDANNRTVIVERHPVRITIRINLDHQRLAHEAFEGEQQEST